MKELLCHQSRVSIFKRIRDIEMNRMRKSKDEIEEHMWGERQTDILMARKIAERMKKKEIERRMEERRCEKQKKYPLDSRCPSNRLVLVGWLVAGLEAGWWRRRQRYEMTGGVRRTYTQASARTARYNTWPVRKDPKRGDQEGGRWKEET